MFLYRVTMVTVTALAAVSAGVGGREGREEGKIYKEQCANQTGSGICYKNRGALTPRDPGVCAIDALSMLTSFDYFFLLLLRTTRSGGGGVRMRRRRRTVTGDDDVARLLSIVQT